MWLMIINKNIVNIYQGWNSVSGGGGEKEAETQKEGVTETGIN